MTEPPPDETRVLLLAPTAKDAAASRDLLRAAGIPCSPCRSTAEVCARLPHGAGAVVVPEEAVLNGHGEELARALAEQPNWSSLPVIVLTAAGPDSATKIRAILELGDVTLLKRPLEVMTFVNAVRAALRDRRRQYQMRDRLAELQLAQEALRESESRLQLALGAAEMGTFVWHAAEDRTEPDARMLALFGLTPGSPLTLASALGRLIHPDDRARYAAAVARATDPAGAGELREDIRVLHPDGAERWLTIAGRTEFAGAPPRAARMAGTAADITARKEAEAALRASERRLRALVTASSYAVYRMSPDWAELWELEGRGFLANAQGPSKSWLGNYVLPEDQPQVMAAIREAIANKSLFELEHRVRRADGTPGWTLSRAVPLLDARGEITEWFGAANDMTERRAMEEELRDAGRKKDDFIALLAHELRNPLAPIRNGLQVLRLAAEDLNAADQARAMMERQLTHMVRLVDDLLDVSRISRNKMELRRERVLLADAVSAAVETARPFIEAAGHDLHVELPPGPVYLDADLTRLAQVFSNLLTNSAKYTGPSGRIRLTAECRADEVVVTVSDNGIGIPAGALGNIFDMFSQVGRSIERSAGGLGLGLALVRALVEMHGGTVTAASDGEEKGSTFTIRLPPAEASREPSGAGAPADGRPGARRRVLVVDDNEDGAASMAMMLRLLGDEVRTAHDGIEAMEQAEAFRPEVVLMDVGMPRLNGLEATRRIRARAWGRDMTIIALTGWGQGRDRDSSREAGCDGHLVKPVNLTDLQKLLAEVGGRRG